MPNSSQLAVKTQWTLSLFNNLIKDIIRPIAMPGAGKTLASNTITLTPANGEGYYTVDTSGAGPVDTLTTINGGSDGDIVYLLQANAARSVQLSAAGNILMPASWAGGLTLSATIPIGFRYNATLTKWIILSLFDPTAEFWKNNSGGSLSQGNVVTFDKSGITQFKTTIIQGDKGVLGVVLDSQIGNGAWGWIGVGGRRKVLLNAAVTVGQALITSTVAGLAIPNGGSQQDGYIGYVVDATGSPSYCLAEIHPNTNRTGGQATIVTTTIANYVNVPTAGTPQTLLSAFSSSGNNRLIVAVVHWYQSANPNITAFTWNGYALSAAGVESSSGNGGCAVYYLLAPVVGTGDFVITMNASGARVDLVAILMNDINQSTPVGTPVIAQGTSANPAVACSCTPGDYVLGIFEGIVNQSVSSRGAGQTNIDTENNTNMQAVTDIINPATGTTASFSWVNPGSGAWSAVTVPIHPL